MDGGIEISFEDILVGMPEEKLIAMVLRFRKDRRDLAEALYRIADHDSPEEKLLCKLGFINEHDGWIYG